VLSPLPGLPRLAAEHPCGRSHLRLAGLRDKLPLTAVLGRSHPLIIHPLDTPVKDVIAPETLPDKEIPKYLPQVGVVGLVIEAKRTRIVEKYSEFIWEAAAQKVGGCFHFLPHDHAVILLLRGPHKTLPGKRASQEVDEDIGKGL